MSALGELVVKLSANIAEFTGSMDKAAWTSQKRMDEMVQVANRAGVAIGAAMAAAAGSVAVAMKLAVDRMDELGESAQKLGITTEALSGLEYAASMSGVTVETLSGSINKLNRSAADGNPAFAAMGISIKSADGALKSADQLLVEVAGKFAGYKDGAEKSALAMEIFGKSGADMIPMLNQGSTGLRELVAEAERMGLVIGKDATEAAGRFNDTMDRVRKTQGGIVDQMTVALLPVLERGATEFENTARTIDMVSGPAKAMTVLFQTLAVLGSDVAFVFKMTGQEIGGMAAQIAALAKGDMSGFSAIREMMVADAAAARTELDAFQARIMSIGTAAAAAAKEVESAGSGRGIAAPIIDSAKASTKAVDEAKRALAALMAEGKRVFEQTRTPAEQLSGEYERLNKLAQAGAIDQETYARAVEKAQKAFDATTESGKNVERLNKMIEATPTAALEKTREDMILLRDAFEEGRITSEQFVEAAQARLGSLSESASTTANNVDLVISNAFKSAGDAIADFTTGGKTSFSDLIMSMIKNLISLQAQMAMTQAFQSVGGSSGIWGAIAGAAVSYFSGSPASASTGPSSAAGGGSWLGSGQSLNVSGRANGGSVSAGTTYLVGENGPELLTLGNQSGVVTPNSFMGGPSAQQPIRVVIENNGTEQQVDSADTEFDMDGIVLRVVTSDVERDGKFAQAMQRRYGLNRANGAYG